MPAIGIKTTQTFEYIMNTADRTQSHLSCKNKLSNIRHKDFRSSVSPSVHSLSVMLMLPPLDSEMGCTGELWSNIYLLKWQNYDNSMFYLQK